jgi:hypothetical protein
MKAARGVAALVAATVVLAVPAGAGADGTEDMGHRYAACLERYGHRLAVADSDRLREVARAEYARCLGQADIPTPTADSADA